MSLHESYETTERVQGSWDPKRILWVAVCLMAVLSSGCMGTIRKWRCSELAPCVPPHLFDAPRGSREPINYLLLQQPTPKKYKLGPEDVLGIYIEGVLGESEKAPPVIDPQQPNLPPAVGYPVTVREDGTLSLPLIDPIYVNGMSLNEVENAIRKAYTVDRDILRVGRDRIIVSIIQLRTHHVLVIREDLGSAAPMSVQTRRPEEVLLEPQKRGRAYALELPAYRNDVLHALTESGGMPGADAKAQVRILRNAYHPQESTPPPTDVGIILSQFVMPEEDTIIAQDRESIVIPLQVGPGIPYVELNQDIITLHDGDVVVVESRESEVYYTGGLLKGGQHPIPRDYDLDILGAVASAGGSIAAAAGGSLIGPGSAAGNIFPPTRVTVIRVINGYQVPIRVNLKRAILDPSERILIQPNDFVLLEYTPTESFANVVLNNVIFSFSGSLFTVR